MTVEAAAGADFCCRSEHLNFSIFMQKPKSVLTGNHLNRETAAFKAGAHILGDCVSAHVCIYECIFYVITHLNILP